MADKINNYIVSTTAVDTIDIVQRQEALNCIINLGLAALTNLNEGGDLTETEELARELQLDEPVAIATPGCSIECPSSPEDGVMGLDAGLESNYAERARIVLTQWHVDEVVGDQEAYEYANCLIKRLEQYGLMIVPAGFVDDAVCTCIVPHRFGHLDANCHVCGLEIEECSNKSNKGETNV